jgi:hypothetical protein
MSTRPNPRATNQNTNITVAFPTISNRGGTDWKGRRDET